MGRLYLNGNGGTGKKSGFFSGTFFLGVFIFAFVPLILCCIVLMLRRQKLINSADGGLGLVED